MKLFEYEYNVGNCPDTMLVFVWAESVEEAAAALEVDSDELFAVNPDGQHYKAWRKHYKTYRVLRGELV